MNPVCDDSRASNGWIAGRPRLCSFVFCASFAGRSRRLARKASLRAPITIVAAPSPSPVIARTILSSREREIDEMHAQAHKLGFFCRPASVYLQDLATRIAMHLKNRLGTMVYQTVGFSMENFPLELAYQTFAMASMQSSTSQGTTTWRIETMDQTNLVFGSIFEEFHEKCVGASKPLQSPSEPVVRVLATIISGAEISHVKLARGVERLYINFMYALTDEAGTMHFPKDAARNEIALNPAQITSLRAQVWRRMRRAWASWASSCQRGGGASWATSRPRRWPRRCCSTRTTTPPRPRASGGERRTPTTSRRSWR